MKIVSQLFLLVLCFHFIHTLFAAPQFFGGPDGGLYDTFGRYRIFHGTNFVLKEPPWYPAVLLNESNVAQYAAWGMNAVRLGTMWTGAQPDGPSSFDEGYYDTLLRIVDLLSAHGVYAILDCHQDVLSSFFCLYDGAPRWLVNRSLSDPEVLRRPFPDPLPNNASGCYGRPWAENYLALATSRAFQDIYSDAHGNRQAFAAFWAHTAARFAASSFLGYEFLNEPWCGDYFRDPALLLPGGAGRLNLQPLYRHLHAAIAQHDQDHLFFFEPVTWGVIFDGRALGTGFTEVPGGDPARTALSWHYYCWFFSEQHAERALCDREMGPHAFAAVHDDAVRLATGGFLTEWGLCDPSQPAGLAECRFVMQMADRYALSWTNWDWGAGQLQYGWQLDDQWIAAMVRPYVQAYAGVPQLISFDPDTLQFVTNFSINATIDAPTELYLPPLHYPEDSYSLATTCLTLTNESKNPSILTFRPLNPQCIMASILITSLSSSSSTTTTTTTTSSSST